MKDWSEESKKYLFGEIGMDIILMGNPGCGKSTLISSLSKTQFESGLSKTGAGVTTDVKWLKEERTLSYPDGEKKVNLRWADTPGLADIKNQSKFANTIEKALKRGGSYKIIFMVTEEAGRIHPADVATMNLIGNSLEHCEFQYGIILNKLSEDMYDLLCNDEKSKRIMLNAFNQTGTSKRKPTSDIWLYAYDESLVDKSDIVPNLAEGVVNFIHSIPPTIIDPSKVQPIQVNRYDDLVSDYKDKMNEIDRLENIIQKLETEKLQLTLEQQRDINNFTLLLPEST